MSKNKEYTTKETRRWRPRTPLIQVPEPSKRRISRPRPGFPLTRNAFLAIKLLILPPQIEPKDQSADAREAEDADLDPKRLHVHGPPALRPDVRAGDAPDVAHGVYHGDCRGLLGGGAGDRVGDPG